MTTYLKQSLTLVPLVLAVLCLQFAGAAFAQAQAFRIQVTADPNRLNYVAGESNRTTIRVTVRDTTGQNAPNMTPVYLRTTLGYFTSSGGNTVQANTQNGQVIVQLENRDQGAGKAVIDVTAGTGTPERIYVEFLGPGQTSTLLPTKQLYYTFKAKQCEYSVDRQRFDLIENAQFIAPSFTVKADRLQYDIQRQTLNAQSFDVTQNGVTITVGDRTISAQALILNISSKFGAIRLRDPELVFKQLTYPEFAVKDDEGETARRSDFNRLEIQPARSEIICSQAVLIPGKQLQFKHPRFYLGGIDKCLMVLPYHVIDLTTSQRNTFINANINLTSDAGIDVDFPIYYDAAPNHTGAVHLRSSTKGSSYTGNAGFQIGIEEEYLAGEHGDGALYLDDVIRPTRSLTWNHNHQFGKLDTSVGVSYSRYDDDAPYTAQTNISLARMMGEIPVSLSTYWSNTSGVTSGTTQVQANMPPIPILRTGLSLGFSPYIGWNRSFGTADGASSVSTNDNGGFTEGLRGNVGFPTIRVLGGTLSPNLNDEIAHNPDGSFTNFFDTGVRYQRALSKSFSTSVGYSYSLATSSNDVTTAKPTQHVNFDLFGGGEAWSLAGYGSYSIDSKSVFSSLSATYFLPWDVSKRRGRQWYLEYGANFTYTKDTPATADHIFTLGRILGSYTLLVHYSPTGNNAVTGFGTGTGKKWAFELVRQGW